MGIYTIAIAAPNFSALSETFIHDHVRTLSPNDTILLCEDERGAEHFGCPVLNVWKSPTTAPEKFAGAVRRRWQRHVRPGFAVPDRRRMESFLESYEPKALLAEFGPTGCLVMSACSSVGVPLYVFFHGYDATVLARDLKWRNCFKRLFAKATGVIVASNFMAEKLVGIGCPRQKLHLARCGIDVSRFSPTQHLPNRVVAVGRLVEKKAPHLTIEAFGKVARRIAGARLDMVGDGPLSARCHELISRLGLNDVVHMHGAQPLGFVRELLGQASVFVQHSVTALNGDTEGLGVSILEAMASAIPVVVTRHNGFTETVIDGVTGVMIEEHDVEGMAQAVVVLLTDQQRALSMGLAGRERVIQHFSLADTTKRLRAVLEINLSDGVDDRPVDSISA